MPIVDGKNKIADEVIEKPIEYKEKDGKTYRVILEEEDENSYINQFKKSFESGLKGETIILSTGFPKLDNYFSIRKKVYYAVGASTGVGKTSFTDEGFVFNPAEWFLQQKDPKFDLQILYWSLERSVDEKIARWISRKIFLNHNGLIVTPDEILSRKVDFKLSDDKASLVRKYMIYIKEIMDKVLTIHGGSHNPQDIRTAIKEFALKRGKFEAVMIRKSDGHEYIKSVYITNKPNELILIVVDPVNRISTKQFKETLTKKAAIDQVSEILLYARDTFGYSPVATCQFNRGMSETARLNSERGVLPMLSDFKETSNISEDSEVCIVIFDPTGLKVEDAYGYNLSKLRERATDKTPGNKKYRSISVLKNSYGASDVGIGLAFQPQTGIFSQLKFPSEMTEEDYNDIITDKYFLKNRQ